MKVHVDPTICVSCGACKRKCSEVFSLDSGVSVAMEGEIPKQYEEAVREAVTGCPVDAISIDE